MILKTLTFYVISKSLPKLHSKFRPNKYQSVAFQQILTRAEYSLWLVTGILWLVNELVFIFGNTIFFLLRTGDVSILWHIMWHLRIIVQHFMIQYSIFFSGNSIVTCWCHADVLLTCHDYLLYFSRGKLFILGKISLFDISQFWVKDFGPFDPRVCYFECPKSLVYRKP
jgi:hypothetical protein